MSPKSCDVISRVLKKRYATVGVTSVNNKHDLEALTNKQPDLVFLAVKYLSNLSSATSKPSGLLWLPNYLDDTGLNYTGSQATAIALDVNKPFAKEVVKSAGLHTSPFFTAKQGEYKSASELPLKFPLFIKPSALGSGKGIGDDSVVRNITEFEQKVRSIIEDYQTEVLVEEYLSGREFSVAILEDTNSEELICSPVEIIMEQNDQGDRILGSGIKTADTEQVTAVFDEAIKKSVVELAISVFKILGARDYGRIDIRLDAQGIPHFLEANLVPGLGQGYFARALWLNHRMSHEELILRIVELASSRDIYIKEKVISPVAGIDTMLPMPGTVL